MNTYHLIYNGLHFKVDLRMNVFLDQATGKNLETPIGVWHTVGPDGAGSSNYSERGGNLQQMGSLGLSFQVNTGVITFGPTDGKRKEVAWIESLKKYPAITYAEVWGFLSGNQVAAKLE